ncbi:hypothetical protein BC940DRAFT_275132 [Gongronella butleri]|nr:hypothetical protein BC940DRAFT_275132 [Gongronella butleri]
MLPSDEDQDMKDSTLPLKIDDLPGPALPPADTLPSEPIPEPANVLTEWQAIGEKELAPLDEEVLEYKVSHWEITDWAALPDRQQGPIFEAGNHRWNILLFPRGNTQRESVSIYLEFTDAKASSENYSCAQFVILVSKPTDPTAYCVHSGQHRFQSDESDWGFTRFMEMAKMENEYIEQGAVRISVIVKVVKDPTGVLWHNFQNYDSKQMTGYVGLKNQGATCYMNSLFQSLYCTNYFRKAVYQIPTENDTPSESVALALQRLFYNLQYTDSSVGTNELTKSFGWDTLDAFMQHDVQEFNRVLQDNLEIKMKGTPADGAIKHLFVGKMKSYIRCINVDFESSRSEDYYDIQLNVKGCPNLEASFKDYVAEEILDGDNKYMAEGHGLQDAKKGVIFESFPPVLHLQLKRFEYNIMTDRMVKINDRHEFPLTIDLEPFLSESADKSQSHEYVLHGVLVHSGDLGGGHYLAFVKPTKEDRWLKFDDDRVVPATLKEVLEENFGGEQLSTTKQPRPPTARVFKRYTNAYMLVYVRRTLQDEILAPVTDDDIPKHLLTRFENERKTKDALARERKEEHLYMKVWLATDELFQQHEGLDFMDPINMRKVRARKDQPYGEYKQELANLLGIPVTHFRPWTLVNRQNRTIRPEEPIPDNEAPCKMEEIYRRHVQQSQSAAPMRIYIERPAAVTEDGMPIFPEAGRGIDVAPPLCLIFIKLFDPWHQRVCGLNKLYVSPQSKISSILDQLRELAGFDPRTDIDLYEEIKPEMIENMELNKTFQQSEIQDGDILVMQRSLTEDEIEDLTAKDMYYSAPEFMNYLFHRRVVTVAPIEMTAMAATAAALNVTNVEELRFDLELLTTMTYDEVTQAIAQHIGVPDDAPKVRLFSLSARNKEFKPMPRFPGSGKCFGDFITYLQQNIHTEEDISTFTRCLAFDILDVPLAEFENSRQIKVTCLSPGVTPHPVTLIVPKNGRFADLLRQVHTTAGISFNGPAKTEEELQSPSAFRHLRVYEAVNCRVNRVYNPSDSLIGFSDSPSTQLFIEPIPEEEKNMGDEDTLIDVFHFSRDINRTHSIPFKFLVIKDEPWQDTKTRLQLRTGINDKDWAKVRICLASQFSATPVEDENDEFKLSDHQWHRLQDSLGLEHVDKTGRAQRNHPERGLTIRG